MATALHAGTRGLADLYYYPVKKYLGVPGQRPEPVRLNLEQAEHLILQAGEWDSGNPDILRANARLLDRKATDRYFWQSIEVGALRKSLSLFRKAAGSRPSSPWLWSDIALMKAKLGEYDNEMQQAIILAAKLGPWQPLVQFRLAETGLAVWPRLSLATRMVVMENIRRGLRRKSRYLLAKADNHNKMALLCRYLGDEPQLQAKCGH